MLLSVLIGVSEWQL